MTTVGHRYAAWPVSLALLVVTCAVGVATVHVEDSPGLPLRWPAAGLAVALLVVAPRRWWWGLVPGLALATALAPLSGGADVLPAVLFGVACAAGALVAARVLAPPHQVGLPPLATQEDFVRLVLAALAGAGVAGLGVAASLASVTGEQALATAWAAFGGHLASNLVVVTVALSLAERAPLARLGELVVQAGATAAVTVAVFVPGQDLGLAFVPLPFLVWGALRFDVRTVALELGAFAVLVAVLTARGEGPFGAGLESLSVEMAAIRQGYVLCVVLLTVPLAIAVQQRAALLERVRADELLFRRNFTESLAGMLMLRETTGGLVVADLNETAATALGAAREALVGRPLDDVLDCPEPLSGITRRLRSGDLPGWHGRAGATRRPNSRLEVAIALLSDGGGDPIWSAQLLDVTAEHEAHRRLETAEKLTSATLDTTACLILVTDLDGVVVRVNAATTAMTGYAAGELVGRPVWETPVSPSDAADVGALFLWPNRSGVPVVRERDVVTRSGDRLRVVWSSSLVHDEQGLATFAVMTGIDVTAERTSAGLVSHLMQASYTTAMVGIDGGGRVTVLNSGAQHLLGLEPAEVVGRQLTGLLCPDELLARTGTDDPEKAFELLTADLGPDGETRARDWTWIGRDERRHVVSMTLSVAQDTITPRGGFLCVGRDVTEQRQGQEMLVAALEKERTAVERLRGLDEAKNEFVSTVSHELRTPVTSILGYTEMLQDGSVVAPHPEQLPMLDTIHRNSERLIAVCNDLLQLSGLDAGTVRWARDPVDLTSLLGPVEDSIRPMLQHRRLRWDVAGPGTPVLVTGDRAQLERVVLNLLSNAVKFTEDGGSVECRLSTDGGHAVLTVRDTGIGIPADEQEHLFEKFFRSSTAQRLAIQGTGLGLAIVAAIVEAHGGRISVDSVPRRGTTFSVRLPLAG